MTIQDSNLPSTYETVISPLDVDNDEKRQIGRSLNEVIRPKLPQKLTFLNEIIETLLLVLAIYVMVNLATARFVVDGTSMQPNFHTDQYIIVSRFAYIIGEPQRGDVVVFHANSDKDFIKRVIGLPGETIQIVNGKVYINNKLIDEPYLTTENQNCASCNLQQPVTLGKDEYFVLGDNRRSSQDSRSKEVGAIKRSQIIGKAWIRYWPPEEFTLIEGHEYHPIATEPLPSFSPINPTNIPQTPTDANFLNNGTPSPREEVEAVESYSSTPSPE